MLVERSAIARRYILMFVPPIEPGLAPSQIEYGWRWPKAAQKLVDVGQTDRQVYVLPPGPKPVEFPCA